MILDCWRLNFICVLSFRVVHDNALLICCAWQWTMCVQKEIKLCTIKEKLANWVQKNSIEEILDFQKVKSLYLWWCLWIDSVPGPGVLAPAIILPSFGSGYVWWTVFSSIWELSRVLAWHPVVCLSIKTLHYECQLLQTHPCMQTCVCVCVWHTGSCTSCCLPTWTLTHSRINVRGLRQARYAAFHCDRHVFGLHAACRVKVWHNAWCQHKHSV